MNRHELVLYLLKAGFEILLCILVFARTLKKRLPFFSLSAATLLACTLSTGLVYWRYGFRSSISYYTAWVAVGVGVLARSSAISELCYRGLQAYRGIWALAWRFLGFMTIFLLGHAALDARASRTGLPRMA